MAQGFNMELRAQQEWSWLVAMDLFLGGLGGGLFLLYQMLNLPPFIALVAVALVLLGGMVLLLELGHPLRAWRAIFRPRTSWISRGVLAVSIFIVTASIHIAPAFTNSTWRLWAGENMGAKFISFLAGLCALFITLYPGFVLAASRSIPFWNTPMLPVLFFTQSLMGASGIVLLTSLFRSFDGLRQVESLAMLLMVLNLVITFIYLLAMARSSVSAKESVRLLNQSSLGWTFRIVVIGIGMVLPLALVVWFDFAAAAAGAFMLCGGLLFRYCVLKAGVYAPSALVGMDMSKLNRTDDELAREYTNMAARRG